MQAIPTSSSENATLNPAHQRVPGGRSMGRQTSSVTADGFLWPAISGMRSGEQTSAIVGSFLLGSVADDLQVAHGRPHVQLFEHAVGAAVAGQARDATLAVVQV